jgi:hypothetical protein
MYGILSILCARFSISQLMFVANPERCLGPEGPNLLCLWTPTHDRMLRKHRMRDVLQECECVWHMPNFPGLWAWSTKLTGNEKFVPIALAYNPRQLPNEIRFSDCKWLCPAQHLSASVRQAFPSSPDGSPSVPTRVRVHCSSFLFMTTADL